jgi:hypothetical protein
MKLRHRKEFVCGVIRLFPDRNCTVRRQRNAHLVEYGYFSCHVASPIVFRTCLLRRSRNRVSILFTTVIFGGRVYKFAWAGEDWFQALRSVGNTLNTRPRYQRQTSVVEDVWTLRPNSAVLLTHWTHVPSCAFAAPSTSTGKPDAVVAARLEAYEPRSR